MTNLTTREIATINSKEVAEMMDMEHSKLLRKISGINKDFTEAKIGLSDYWLESSYLDASGKSNKCYEVTKMGCEFLAHKSTGTKGNIFTAKYMQRFNEMEKELQNQTPQLSEKDMLRLKLFSKDSMEVVAAHNRLIELETAPLLETIEEQQPVVDYAGKVLDSKNTCNITQIAKDYGISGKRLNEILNEIGVQYKSNGQWLLYSKYQDKGYTESMTGTNNQGYTFMQTKWTQKGRMFLYEILKANGYLPLKELN